MNRIGTGLLKQAMAARDGDKGNKSRRKDILSLLVHANALEAEGQRITEEDILARTHKPIFGLVYLLNIFSEIPTFIIAGHETTRYSILQLKLTNPDSLTQRHHGMGIICSESKQGSSNETP